MNLREQVEALLPNWRTWYPSLFDAAVDLGILRARVCDPSTLLLQRRHEGAWRPSRSPGEVERGEPENKSFAIRRRSCASSV
jgi:hypothetical protein